MSEFGSAVWCPDPVDGFVLGTVVDIGANEFTIERNDNKELVKCAYKDVFAAEDNLQKSVEDNCALMYLNEGTLLNNCKLRYQEKKIYSYVANILISINPYEDIPDLYSDATIINYRGKSIGQLPPHIYAIADKAYRDMRRSKESQSIIVSGESGAGKTESQKAVLKYLCDNWGSTAGDVQQRILETNPILEAFGNAKTMRNNNSSRFGKFVEIHFGTEGQVAGGFVSHYLLEKSRIVKQSEGERNYHIFYQMIAGLDDNVYNTLKLAPPHQFNYLRNGNTSLFGQPGTVSTERLHENKITPDCMVDDRRDFVRLCESLEGAGLSLGEIRSIWSTTAAVLHLGNINFVENVLDNRGGCTVDPISEQALLNASQLLGIEIDELRIGLTTRIMQATKGGVKGTLIRVPLKPHEAIAGRDALAKGIYSRMFDWLVAMINKSINKSKDGSVIGSTNYIGVLDIAGFEFFAVNSFEQFCINYCNEKLQYFFNERILRQEQCLYEKEGLNVPHIEYTDNKDCIDLFERRGTGLFDILDEEARLPRASPQHFTQRAVEANNGHFRLETPRKSRLRAHREMRDDEGMLIRHYAGTVCYHTQHFLEKNNDQLHNSLEILIEQSSIAFLRDLFVNVPATVVPDRRLSSNRLQASSVGSKFRAQLNVLIGKLENTGTHFVRCVKPNSWMSPDKFDGNSILGQLKCAGMTAVLKLMQKGFPSRTAFSDLYSVYQSILPPQLARLDSRLFCKCLFRALGLNSEDFKFGLTKVFFRPGKFAEFDQMLRQDPANMQMLVEKVQSWLSKTRWRKAQYGALCVIKLKNKILYRAEKIVRIQSAIRGFVTRKQYKPRLVLYRSALNLSARSKEMSAIISELQPNSAEKWEEPIFQTTHTIDQLVYSIKGSNIGFDVDEATKKYEECVKKVDEMIAELKEQVECDKNERILKLERKRKEEEERQAREKEEEERAEKERQMRKEMELEREKEEEKWREMMKKAETAEKEAEEKKRLEQIESERLDTELATRIAKEDKTQKIVESSMIVSGSSSASSNCTTVSTIKDKIDLSGWKYSDLRETINTTKDKDLLLACKAEFHRRLRVYNEWKSRNANSRDVQPPRVPTSVFNANHTVHAPSTHFPASLNKQRYFKVPFSTPSDVMNNKGNGVVFNASSQNGLWYAHFDGQWICRQIELHPNKTPLLLVAGKDDLQMCELPLDQTTLPRKKGAEIVAHEFETVWTHLGGKPQARWTP